MDDLETCTACGRAYKPGVWTPKGYCSMDCWCFRFNRPAGMQQGDEPENRPGNAKATLDITPHDPPRSFDVKMTEYMRMVRGYENINND